VLELRDHPQTFARDQRRSPGLVSWLPRTPLARVSRLLAGRPARWPGSVGTMSPQIPGAPAASLDSANGHPAKRHARCVARQRQTPTVVAWKTSRPRAPRALAPPCPEIAHRLESLTSLELKKSHLVPSGKSVIYGVPDHCRESL
jgi:hypothetical protein